MARDFKLVFAYSTVASAGAGTAAVAVSTPTGDKTNSRAAITLAVGSGTGGVGVAGMAIAASDSFAWGIRNSKADTTSFANWLAGNEVTAVANDPAIWGNSSLDEMYARGVLEWDFSSSQVIVPANPPYICVQGAYDNGAGSAATATFQPISGALSLIIPTVTVASSVAGTAVITTSAPHNLAVGDGVLLQNITGVTAGLTASTVYVVNSVPTSTTLTLKTTAGSAISSTTGTLTGTPIIYKLRGYTANSNGFVFSIPVAPTVKQHVRLAVVYPTTVTAGAGIAISRSGLVTGRESSVLD